MQAKSDEVYNQINNALYNEQGITWWDENQCLHLLKSSVNPVRVGYFRRLLDEVLKLDCRGEAALDVGCCGGILAEEFARMGFRVTGIDPSEQSLATARQHAQSKGLSIQYQQGTGESIPFADQHPPGCLLLRCSGARSRLAESDRRNLQDHETGRDILFRHTEPHVPQQVGSHQDLAGMEKHSLHAAPASRVEDVYPAGGVKRIACAVRIRAQ